MELRCPAPEAKVNLSRSSCSGISKTGLAAGECRCVPKYAMSGRQETGVSINITFAALGKLA